MGRFSKWMRFPHRASVRGSTTAAEYRGRVQARGDTLSPAGTHGGPATSSHQDGWLPETAGDAVDEHAGFFQGRVWSCQE